jgi:hypothetical protein
MELTVVLTNYLRPANMADLLKSLAEQSIAHRLFAWDNSPDASFPSGRADWLIRSSRNAKCSARWWMAARADTPWVLVMDDDLAPSDPEVLADTLSALGTHSPQAVGAAGVVLNPAKEYMACRHVGREGMRIEAATRVDILKGRYFALATPLLGSLGFLSLDAEDDIGVSASIGGGIVLPWMQDRFRELRTGNESWCRRPDHQQRREAARRKWFNV